MNLSTFSYSEIKLIYIITECPLVSKENVTSAIQLVTGSNNLRTSLFPTLFSFSAYYFVHSYPVCFLYNIMKANDHNQLAYMFTIEA